jgi:hypothetical protein
MSGIDPLGLGGLHSPGYISGIRVRPFLRSHRRCSVGRRLRSTGPDSRRQRPLTTRSPSGPKAKASANGNRHALGRLLSPSAFALPLYLFPNLGTVAGERGYLRNPLAASFVKRSLAAAVAHPSNRNVIATGASPHINPPHLALAMAGGPAELSSRVHMLRRCHVISHGDYWLSP